MDNSGESRARELLAAAFALEPGDDAEFQTLAAGVRNFQRAHCAAYDRFCDNAGMVDPPFPTEGFGLAAVAAFDTAEAQAVFLSSGTTDSQLSRHFVRDLDIYRHSAVESFRMHFGGGRRTILAHLPGYVERGDQSSLVVMMRFLIDAFGSRESGFFLEDDDLLRRALSRPWSDREPVILFGAASGLVRLAASSGGGLRFGPLDVVIETGGLKTWGQTMSREGLHRTIREGFSIEGHQVWSEYGMCELLTQFYQQGNQGFTGPPWVRHRLVRPDDPATAVGQGEEGRLVIVDLANVFTVSEILTGDRAVARGSGFEVLGRIAGAVSRGCNFLVEAATPASIRSQKNRAAR